MDINQQGYAQSPMALIMNALMRANNNQGRNAVSNLPISPNANASGQRPNFGSTQNQMTPYQDVGNSSTGMNSHMANNYPDDVAAMLAGPDKMVTQTPQLNRTTNSNASGSETGLNTNTLNAGGYFGNDANNSAAWRGNPSQQVSTIPTAVQRVQQGMRSDQYKDQSLPANPSTDYPDQTTRLSRNGAPSVRGQQNKFITTSERSLYA